MTIITRGLLDGKLVTRGLAPAGAPPTVVTSYPDPFAATAAPTLDPFAATSSGPPDPFAATARYKGN